MEQTRHLPFQKVKSIDELEQRIAQSKDKYVMLDFSADWCISCKEMERFTFTDAKVQSRLKDVVLLQVDVTAGTPDDAALLKRFRLFGPPGILFLDRQGREIPGVRLIGYQDKDSFPVDPQCGVDLGFSRFPGKGTVRYMGLRLVPRFQSHLETSS